MWSWPEATEMVCVTGSLGFLLSGTRLNSYIDWWGMGGPVTMRRKVTLARLCHVFSTSAKTVAAGELEKLTTITGYE